MIEQIHIVFQIVDTHHRVMDYGSEIEFYVDLNSYSLSTEV